VGRVVMMFLVSSSRLLWWVLGWGRSLPGSRSLAIFVAMGRFVFRWGRGRGRRRIVHRESSSSFVGRRRRRRSSTRGKVRRTDDECCCLSSWLFLQKQKKKISLVA